VVPAGSPPVGQDDRDFYGKKRMRGQKMAIQITEANYLLKITTRLPTEYPSDCRSPDKTRFTATIRAALTSLRGFTRSGSVRLFPTCQPTSRVNSTADVTLGGGIVTMPDRTTHNASAPSMPMSRFLSVSSSGFSGGGRDSGGGSDPTCGQMKQMRGSQRKVSYGSKSQQISSR